MTAKELLGLQVDKGTGTFVALIMYVGIRETGSYNINAPQEPSPYPIATETVSIVGIKINEDNYYYLDI